MSQLGQAWALALSAAFFFGLALVLTQIGLNHLSAAPLKLDVGAWQTDAAAIFAVVGFLFPALVTRLTFEANLRMGPNIAGAVGNLAPFFAVSFAVLALGETPTPVQVIGISVIIVGVTVMSRQGGGDGIAWPLWVLALPLAAAAIRGGIQPAVKLGLAQWPSPFAAALIGYSVSSAVVVAMAVIRTRGWPRGFNLRGSAWFCSVGLCNGMAVLLMYEALGRGSVTLVSPLVASYPLATLALSAFLSRTVRIDRRVVAGVSLTVAGVAFLLAK